MKALSIYAPYAMGIAGNLKTIETRSWATNYRGDILICSTLEGKNNKDLKDYFIFGHAIAVATISDCAKFKNSDRRKAMIEDNIDMQDMYSWHLSNIRPIKPIPIKGQQRIYNTKINSKDLIFLDKKDDDLLNYWINNGYIKK